ncbi:MAG: putative rRNA maturation factor [Chloroflexota bacterium]|jgi:probable rRNA maturation factor|nr:putative rRNA maturation factor [Chloroflexota bacterium]
MAGYYLRPWRIDLFVRGGVRSPVAHAALARLAAQALTICAAPSPASMGLILSDDRELAALNVKHMGHEGPTDVLSFPLLPTGAFPRHPGQDPTLPKVPSADFVLPPGRRPHLGDIIVSVERAAAQAPAAIEDELRQLIVHGVLHVCGWDHAAPEERNEMRALESKVLAS